MSSLNVELVEELSSKIVEVQKFSLVKWPVKQLPKTAGCYVFWWIGDKKELTDAFTHTDLKYQLKKSHKKRESSHEDWVYVSFTTDWIKAASQINQDGDVAICLYIGKSTNIRSRVSKHIKPQTTDIWNGGEVSFEKKPNTVSQLRIGIERVFGKRFNELKSSIAVSFVEMKGDEHAINRFYLEERLIGTLFPLLNIDIER